MSVAGLEAIEEHVRQIQSVTIIHAAGLDRQAHDFR